MGDKGLFIAKDGKGFLIIVVLAISVFSYYGTGQPLSGIVPCISWGGCECSGEFEMGDGEVNMFCRGEGIDAWRLEGYFKCIIRGTSATAADCEKWSYDELDYAGWLFIDDSCTYGVFIEAWSVRCEFTSSCCLGTGHACPSQYIPNRPPRVWGGRESVDEDKELIIDLSEYAEDPDGEPIRNYLVTQYPSHSKFFYREGDKVYYTPEDDWNSSCRVNGGNDSFKFKAQDERGAWSESEATITIHVNPVNDPPAAQGIIFPPVLVMEDFGTNITLKADDPDLQCGGDTLVFNPDEVSEQNGVVTQVMADEVEYTPPMNYNGFDSFSFTVEDRAGKISTAVVKLLILPVNDPPIAMGISATTDEDIPVEITLSGVDPDSDPLEYIIVSNPAHGSLSGTAPDLTYTPEPNYHGPDGFSYRVSDGVLESDPAAVEITVTPVNDPPTLDPLADQIVNEGEELHRDCHRCRRRSHDLLRN